nr:putative reverse transcriptase domain-containing protein [Tanacetum cinerariifolium]
MDKVMLKVSPWKRVIRFGKRGKLNLRYIGPFKILAKVGTVAYRPKLLEQLSRVYSTFHVSNLKKYLSDKTLAIPLDEIQIDDKLHFIEEPIEIMDRENGDQSLPRVTQVSIAGTTSAEQPPLKDKSIWSAQEKRVQKIDRDVNDAMGFKKKHVVVTSDPLALIAEKTKVSKSKEKVVVSSDSEGSEVDDFNQAWMESSSDSDQEINANMVFMAQIEKVLSNSEASSSSADEKISG